MAKAQRTALPHDTLPHRVRVVRQRIARGRRADVARHLPALRGTTLWEGRAVIAPATNQQLTREQLAIARVHRARTLLVGADELLQSSAALLTQVLECAAAPAPVMGARDDLAEMSNLLTVLRENLRNAQRLMSAEKKGGAK